MATFAQSTFSAAGYAIFRPSYPPKLYQTIFAYHQGHKSLLLDLGCGHGLISRELAPSFERVIATDPSPVMVKQAISSTKKESNIVFREASAEDLSFVEDAKVDMVVSGQAAHWFDYSQVWRELTKKVRRNGTLAFWGYNDHVFVDCPAATEILDRYCYGPGENNLGKYWEPGREILRQKLQSVVPPEDAWKDVVRLEYEPGTKGANTGVGERLMHKKVSIRNLIGYWRTFSAFHAWEAQHPERTSREKGGPGDVVDEMYDEISQAIDPRWREQGDKWLDKIVEIEWESYILMARRS